MASKKGRKKSSVSDNKLLALASVALLLISALFFSAIQANKKSLGKTNTGQASQNNQNKTSSKAETIDCTKKLSQAQQSELEKLIAQGKASADACLHMGCGNFF